MKQRLTRHVKTFFSHTLRLLKENGCLLTTGACVAVIIGTAIWTEHLQTRTAPEPPPTGPAQAVSQPLQQPLAEASPPATAQPWHAPLPDMRVLQPFDADHLQRSPASGIWMLHDAIDLEATPGTVVASLTTGQVVAVDDNSVTAAHDGGLTAQYACIEPDESLRPGSTLDAGQRVGTIRAKPSMEAGMPPHLHLRIMKDDAAIDPLSCPALAPPPDEP